MDNTSSNTQYLLASIALALSAAAAALIERSNQYDEIMGGDAGEAQDTPAAAQVTPAAVANAELDKDGLPWDERIHAGTKTKTQKGLWTRKKGVDDAVFDAVVAELRGTGTVTPPAAPVATPPAAPAAPALPSVTIAPPAPVVTPFTKLTDFLAKNTGDGKLISSDWVNQQFAANNTTLAALADNNDACIAWLESFRSVLKQMNIEEVA